MANSLLHEKLEMALKMFAAGSTHALLLHGPGQEEQATVLKYAAELCGVLGAHNIALVGDGEKPATIEDIRNLKSTFRLKSSQQEPRAAIILNANTMDTSAQNAFLKLLEEPPEHTYFLLGAASNRGLLPTIQSRVVKVRYIKPSLSDVMAHFSVDHSEQDIKTAYLLSKGEPTRIQEVLSGESTEKNAVNAAKEILKKSLLERIQLVDEFQKDKDKKMLPEVIKGLLSIYSVGLNNAVEAGKPLGSWEKGLRTTLLAEEALAHNASTRLVALKLMADL